MKTTTPKTSSQNETKPKDNKYVEIKIPRLSLQNRHTSTLLVIVLVIFAFIIGMLTNKVLFLQNALDNKDTQTGLINSAQAINNPAETPAPLQQVDVAIGQLPIIGDENAKVTIVEFSDFQCPFCKQFIDNTYQELYDTYIKTGKAKFAYRHYPLLSIHPNAELAAEASECANEQNKFWEYHDLLFKNQPTWSALAAADAANSFTDYATELSLDTAQFRTCLDSDKYQDKIDQDMADANTVNVDGTPAFFVNGYMLTGAQPFSEFQRLIEQELNK